MAALSITRSVAPIGFLSWRIHWQAGEVICCQRRGSYADRLVGRSSLRAAVGQMFDVLCTIISRFCGACNRLGLSHMCIPGPSPMEVDVMARIGQRK